MTAVQLHLTATVCGVQVHKDIMIGFIKTIWSIGTGLLGIREDVLVMPTYLYLFSLVPPINGALTTQSQGVNCGI